MGQTPQILLCLGSAHFKSWRDVILRHGNCLDPKQSHLHWLELWIWLTIMATRSSWVAPQWNISQERISPILCHYLDLKIAFKDILQKSSPDPFRSGNIKFRCWCNFFGKALTKVSSSVAMWLLFTDPCVHLFRAWRNATTSPTAIHLAILFPLKTRKLWWKWISCTGSSSAVCRRFPRTAARADLRDRVTRSWTICWTFANARQSSQNNLVHYTIKQRLFFSKPKVFVAFLLTSSNRS